MVKLFAVISFAVTVVLQPHPVYAFDRNEHGRVSRKALLLARAVCATDPACAEAVTSPQGNSFVDAASPLEYGTLVSATDYRINPLQILQTFGSQARLPESVDDLDPAVVRMVTKAGLPFLRAASANETHFQGELMTGIRHWHEYAVNVAAGNAGHEPNLFTALILNAVADHFLEDFFAPGHMVTARFGEHDAVALGVHNYYNVAGLVFARDCECFRTELRPFLDLLRDETTSNPSLGKAFAQFDASRATILWGDSNLRRSPAQELIMTVLVARSILDVLESYALRKPVNHFREILWKPYRSDKGLAKGLIRRPRAGLPHGDIWYVTGMPLLVQGNILGFSAGAEMMAGGTTTTRTAYRLDYLAWSTSPYKFEVPATLTEAPARFRGRQFHLGASYLYAHSQSESARGLGAKVAMTLPLIHSQFAVDVARKRYTSGDLSARKISYGASFQTGFSLLQAEVGVGHDYTYRGEELRPALAIRFGLSITAPLSAIPVLSKLDKAMTLGLRRMSFIEEAAAQEKPCE